tara:strand:+ start:2372 stop:3688 length:1317 start_codon:yes stop_codon:yes gene_type:complete
MSIFEIKPIKNADGTILYKGKKYTNENDPNLINQLNIDRQNKIIAQRNRLESQIQPNSILAPDIRAKAAAELANLNGLQTARQFEGRNPAARTVEDIVLNRMPPKVDNSPASLLGITTPDVNINTNSLLPAQPVQSAQPQPKKTLGQRAGGLLDRVSDAYMGAAPIFAVAQEFQKAGALRPAGGAMQGDPYGKMMQIQQGRQQAENLAQLREQYPQFANLSDKNFEEVITSLAKDGKLNKTATQKQPLTLDEYKKEFPKVYEGDSMAAEGYGFFDTIQKGVSKVTGAVGLPLKNTEIANAATQTFNKEVMEAQKTKYNTRDSVFQMKYTMEMLPTPKMNEYQALQQHYNIRDVFQKAKVDLEAELNDPTLNLTGSQEANLREGIRKFNNIVLRANNRIASLEKARGVSMNVTSSTPNWEKSIDEALSTFGVLENVRSS